MNYKEWLEKTISDMLIAKNDKLKLKVYEQSNARYDGGIYDCTIIINGLGGTTDADIQIVPIQLMCLSGGQIEVDEDGNTAYDVFYEVLKEFCQTYNLTSNLLGWDYYKHSYVQPFPINPLESDSGTFRINFVISGSLAITKEVNDINKIIANGQEIKFIDANLSYYTTLSPTNKIGQQITTNSVQFAGYRLQIKMYHRTNHITEIARAIRKKEIEPMYPIHIELQYTNGSIDELDTMFISSFTLSNDRLNPSVCDVILDVANENYE